MSSTSSSKVSSLCANCGKGEEAGIKLKTCTACKLVKYCSRDCQIAHRPQHKKACKKKVKELHEEKLFKQPPPDEDCPICMIRLPLLIAARTYMSCCGKVICSGCIHVVHSTHRSKDLPLCPFCRVPNPTTDEELMRLFQKRMELNDTTAICDMGCMYEEGNGLPQNRAKALELWHKAGELGCTRAYYNIGIAYKFGRGVERNEKKAIHCFELAAMRGHTMARHNLGATEARLGNLDRALKHYMISARCGCADSLNTIKLMYKHGDATKNDHDKAIKAYQAYLDEVKSDQRDEAAAFRDEYIYHESAS